MWIGHLKTATITEREITITVKAERDKNAERQKHRTGCTLEFDAVPPTLTPLGNTILTHPSRPHHFLGSPAGMLAGHPAHSPGGSTVLSLGSTGDSRQKSFKMIAPTAPYNDPGSLTRCTWKCYPCNKNQRQVMNCTYQTLLTLYSTY